MPRHVLYLGDSALATAASYLAGVLTHEEIPFHHGPSDTPFAADLLTRDTGALILSDYPVANFTAPQMDAVAARVAAGMGLAMIGGWASFNARGQGYKGSALGDILPVEMADGDDRVNTSCPMVVRAVHSHPIIEGLPLDGDPPCVGGFNRLVAKTNGTIILETITYRARRDENGGHRFEAAGNDPLLVLGSHGAGRVLCLATDVAPHWVGPLVDWGDPRVTVTAPGGHQVEVGGAYCRLMANLVRWLLAQ